jgi:hypothetical protein
LGTWFAACARSARACGHADAGKSLLKAISGGAVDRLPAQQAIRVQPVLELESRADARSTLTVAFWLTSSS